MKKHGAPPAERISLRAPAKINLCLEVVEKRPDGYHSLRSFMAPISLFDELEIEKTGVSGSVEVVCEGKDPALGGEKNLCFRGAEFFFRESGVDSGVQIVLRKNIPVGAGLGGGSSDAAAVIMGLERLFGCRLSRQARVKAAFEVGADVPFFFCRSPAWIEGIGEKVIPSPLEEDLWLVVIHPGCMLSTKEVFSKFSMGLTSKERTSTITDLTFQGVLEGIGNDLQATAEKIEGKISEALDVLAGVGALGGCMSGSGSAVFGLFPDGDSAIAAASEIKSNPIARDWAVEAASVLPSGAFPFIDLKRWGVDKRLVTGF